MLLNHNEAELRDHQDNIESPKGVRDVLEEHLLKTPAASKAPNTDMLMRHAERLKSLKGSEAPNGEGIMVGRPAIFLYVHGMRFIEIFTSTNRGIQETRKAMTRSRVEI